MKLPLTIAILSLPFAINVIGAGDEDVPAVIKGRELAEKILELRPAENFTNKGVLQIRDSHDQRAEIPVSCEIIVTANSWQGIYRAFFTNATETLTITHQANQRNLGVADYPEIRPIYALDIDSRIEPLDINRHEYPSAIGSDGGSADGTLTPFAGSDFTVGDMELEFLHWPEQKILKGETMRGVFCKVLESTNPNPPTNGYSRVVSWIDNESLGIVQAKAYDARGQLLKEFYPKDIKKVNGQWQVGSMEIDNVQTLSRTFLKFDLKAK